MIEILKTNHGFVSMINIPEYWNDELNRELRRGFYSTIGPDCWARCTSDEEFLYIISDVETKKQFEDCVLAGLEYCLQLEFDDYIDKVFENIGSDTKENEIYPEIFCNFIGFDCFYKTSDEIRNEISKSMEKLVE